MILIYTRRERDGEVVGLNPNIRIYRYTPGQFFDAHCKCQTLPESDRDLTTTPDDEANKVALKTDTGSPLPARTTWTLLLYLTSSADGW